MNENGNRYALAALKDKRATLAGDIVLLRRKLAWAEGQLVHVDACLRLFDPAAKPEAIPVKRKRVKMFRQGELSRHILDALRRASEGPLGTREVVSAVIAATGASESARPALAPRVRGNLAYHEGRGVIVKQGSGKAARWALAN